MGGSRQKKAQETSRTGVRLLNDGHMTNDDVGFMLTCDDNDLQCSCFLQDTFNVGEIVWAWNPDEAKWRRAKIIAATRPASLMVKDGDWQQSQDTENCAYIHWKGFDRRLDQWMSWTNLRKENVANELQGEIEWDDPVSDDAHAGLDVEYIHEHQENTKFKTINKIRMGRHIVDCWYFSPYPLEVQNTDILNICQFCLSFFKYEEELRWHERRCTARFPPGNEIYRDETRKLAMWEIDGGISRVYCENVCFLSKLFLDHKTLRHPVNLFLFYVLTEMAPDGYHITGYFSKEKYSRNNVSCILTLPQYQKKGYGKYLINFSYALAMKEGRRGTPERPLSDLGLASYLNYWRQVLFTYMTQNKVKSVCINELADLFSFEPQDIVTCLEEARVLRKERTTGTPYLLYTPDQAQRLTARLGHPPPHINIDNLHWLPYDPFLGPFEYSASAD